MKYCPWAEWGALLLVEHSLLKWYFHLKTWQDTACDAECVRFSIAETWQDSTYDDVYSTSSIQKGKRLIWPGEWMQALIACNCDMARHSLRHGEKSLFIES